MDESGQDTAREPAPTVQYWLNEISASRKREKDFRKEGQRIIDIYSGEKKESVPFNILFSNTETLLPALFSATPRPDVQRRFKDEDPLGKAGATAGQRLLEFLLDTNIDGYETFDEGVRMATLDGLLPGRGVATIKYDFTEGSLGSDNDEPTPYKKSELVCVDTRSWNRVYFGYAKKWSKVPWIAYEEHLDRTESKRLFGDEVTARIQFTKGEETDNEEDRQGTNDDDRNTGERKTALVYQIWDKTTRRVRYISPQYPDGYLLDQEDPLQLTGFFNTPRPLQFLEKSNDLLPVALYTLYENQAKELNRLTLRINRIVEAIKAKGIYDSELGEDIKNLVEADDNQLVPADKSSSLAAEKGLQNAIWYMPLDVLVGVLEKLYAAREQCKRVIYEVTGISDIIRGSTAASETATAQRIKSDWGTLRLKRLQKEVQRYARDLLRMMLEVAASKFSESTWAKMTGLPFLTTEQRQQLEMVAQNVKLQASQMAATGQQPSPQQMQQLQQVQAEMQKPVWGQVLEMLRDDMQRAYRIDIETNSTVEPEAVEDQKKIAEVMTALGQYLNGITPLVVSGAMPFQAAQAMMLAIVRRYRFGNEIEDYIKQMTAPKPQDDGKAAAAQVEQAKMQAQQQQEQARMQFEMQKAQADAQMTQQVESAKHQREVESEQAKIALEQAKIQAERESRQLEIDAEKQAELAKLQAQRATEQMKAQMQQETELQKAAITAATQIEIAKLNAETQRMTAEKEDGDNAAKEAKEEQSSAAMQESIKMMAEALRQLAAPKKVERDKSGRVLSIVPGAA